MGFREQGVPDACYFGCPSINFPTLEAASNIAERDIVLAQQIHISDEGIAALQERANKCAVDAERVTGPVEKLSGPWRPEIPDAIRGKIAPIECCHIAGIIALNFDKKDPIGEYHIRRPGAEPETDKLTEEN